MESDRQAAKSDFGLGATYLGNGRCQFLVWAPLPQRVELVVASPEERVLPMERDERGYWRCTVDGVEPGDTYRYRLDGARQRPDPASRFQPEGVHGPSQVIARDTFAWEDHAWPGVTLDDFIIYELHVGTFTSEGTFDAIIPHLDDLKGLGVTAVELMPVAQFPGSRNWGYDGVYPFAVQDTYGGPGGLKRLVNACHTRGLAAVLDVVYNHLGPEGNYLGEYGPYFTDRYHTPWGLSFNLDGPHSDEVRCFFIENALYWLTEFHFDALRLDAVDWIRDISARTFLEELAFTLHEQAERLGRRFYLTVEDDLNDPRVILPQNLGGYGLDAQWNDDFHHVVHVLLTGERTGYYQDYSDIEQLAKAFRDGFVYTGEYSRYRKHRRGALPLLNSARQFVVFAQNHDQVGNRSQGERLSQLVSFDGLKLAAGVVLLSPYVPLLFMGEEYGEVAPFHYFISHSDKQLEEAVQQGRAEEYELRQGAGQPPDPCDENTFLRSKIDHHLRHHGHHQVLLSFYQELIRLRKSLPALASLSKENIEVIGFEKARVLYARRWSDGGQVFMISNFGDSGVSVAVPVPAGRWRRQLDSADYRWNGSGSSVPHEIESDGEATFDLNPKAFVLFARAEG